MIRVALDTNIILDYSNYLKEYNGNITKYDIQDLVEDKKLLINNLISNLESVFHNSEVSKINFDNPKFPNYYSINEMYIDMLKSGQLTHNQTDNVVQQLKNNYKQFTKSYEQLVNYDPVNKRKISNNDLLNAVKYSIDANKNIYHSIINNIDEISYKSELVSMFELAKGDNPKVEFVITKYVEREIFTHVKGTKENREANELWRKNNPGVAVREIKTFDANLIKQVIKDCSFYDFSKKANERVSMLVQAIKGDTNKVGVKNKSNALGYDGDPECVASAQCLGLMLVSRNMKDMKGKGININSSQHNLIAKEYLQEKENASKLKNNEKVLIDNIKKSISKIESYKNQDIFNVIYEKVNEIACDTNRQSEIVEPNEILDKNDMGTLEEKPELLGLKVTHRRVNQHIVENDRREYKSTYKIQAFNTTQQNTISNINNDIDMAR